jgi:MFS family permease
VSVFAGALLRATKLLARVSDPAIRVIYATILLLGVAYGLAISLIANYLENRGFSKEQIGSLAIWFAGGIVAFSIPAGALIRRFSGKVVLVASLAGYALTVALFPFMPGYLSIGALRFLDGAFSVGVWVSSETILLSRAPTKDKAFATSVYAISLALGYVVGPVLSHAIAPAFGARAAFITAGVISALNALNVTARLNLNAPVPTEGDAASDSNTRSVDIDGDPSQRLSKPESSLSSLAIINRIKTSCLATFCYGYFQASVVLFLPLYLKETKGLTEDDTILIPAFFAGGMLIFANVAARIGDSVGHLLVMRALGAIGTLTIVSFLFVQHPILVYGLVFMAGASLASVSPVSLALQGSVIPSGDLSRAGGFYNAFYAIGMLVGPPITSQIYAKVTGEAMIEHFAVLWGCFVVFTIVFRRDDPRAVTRAAAALSQQPS